MLQDAETKISDSEEEMFGQEKDLKSESSETVEVTLKLNELTLYKICDQRLMPLISSGKAS